MVMEGQGRGMCRDTILSLRGNALHPVVGLISLARSVVWGYAGGGPLAGLALRSIRGMHNIRPDGRDLSQIGRRHAGMSEICSRNVGQRVNMDRSLGRGPRKRRLW